MKLFFALMVTAFLLSGCMVSVTATPIRSTGLSVGSLSVPQRVDDCKEGGWRQLVRPSGSTFKNQGACVSYVQTGR